MSNVGQAEAAARRDLVEDVDGAVAQLLRVEQLAGGVDLSALRGRLRGHVGRRGRRRRGGGRGRRGRRVHRTARVHFGEEVAVLLQTNLQAASPLLDGRLINRPFAAHGQQLALLRSRSARSR